MAEPDEVLVALRKDVARGIEQLRLDVRMSWELMQNDVGAARDEFVNARQDLIEKRLLKLAIGAAPTLFETIFGFAMSFVPFEKIVDLGKLWARSYKLSGVIGASRALGTPMSKARLQAVIAAEGALGPAGRYTQQTFLVEVSDYSAVLTKLADTVPTAALTSRMESTIKDAAKSSAKPVVSTEDMFNTKAVPPKGARYSPADLLKSINDWIVRARNVDDHILLTMVHEIQDSDDFDQIKAGEAFLKFKEFSPAGLNVSYNRTAFQHYVEILLWCTTWDFRPQFQPASRGDASGLVKPWAPAALLPPPMGEDFWKFATERYVDPVFGGGTSTYGEVGLTKQLGTIPPDTLEPGVAKALPSSGTVPPEVRMAYHWGNVIAPAFLNFNRDIARTLLGQGVVRGRQSTPTELDIFYQYLLGYRKLED